MYSAGRNPHGTNSSAVGNSLLQVHMSESDSPITFVGDLAGHVDHSRRFPIMKFHCVNADSSSADLKDAHVHAGRTALKVSTLNIARGSR
jgi:hypothetical protein